MTDKQLSFPEPSLLRMIDTSGRCFSGVRRGSDGALTSTLSATTRHHRCTYTHDDWNRHWIRLRICFRSSLKLRRDETPLQTENAAGQSQGVLAGCRV